MADIITTEYIKSAMQAADEMNARVGTSETADENDYWIGTTLTNGSAIDYTVPADSGFSPTPVEGMVIPIYQLGAGQVTIVASGSTLRSADSALKLRAQYSSAALVHLAAANTWLVVGDVVA